APEAVSHFNRATLFMMADTQADYDRAVAELDRALEMDARYGDAQALDAVAQILVGSDLQRSGRQLLAAVPAGDAAQASRALEDGAQRIAKGVEHVKRALAQKPV